MDALQRYNFMHQAGAVTAHDGRFVLYDEHDRLMAEKDEALLRCAASLTAAISLLERGGKAAKKAAPSNRMFDQMLLDYKASLEFARAALEGK